MALINIKDLTFGYDGTGELLFDHIDLALDTTWKLALAGRNGRGKTTFFRLLRGELPYEGTITGVPRTVSFGDGILNDAEEWRVRKELNLMDTDPDIMWRDPGTLSGGEQTKLMLARLFSSEDIYPLIDEPTNHLDMAGRQAVAEYLARKEGFILISHDRDFLDHCIDHTLVITKTGVELTASTFSTWWDNNEQRLDGERARNAQLQKEINVLNEAARKNRTWSASAEKAKYRSNASPKAAQDHWRRAYEGSKSKKMMSLASNIQRRNEKKIEEKTSLLKDVEKAEKLKITASEHHSRTPVILKDLTLMRDGNVIVSGLDLTVGRGSKTALLGRNGSGKSTLLQYIRHLGEDGDITGYGDIYFASGLKISYVDQDTSALTGTLKDLACGRGTDITQLSTILIKMGFTKDMLERDVDTFSLGQKKCTVIALSLCDSADIYIWDEPLNYIDVYMRVEIERLVQSSDITLLFTEHDRAFCDAVADGFLELQ